MLCGLVAFAGPAAAEQAAAATGGDVSCLQPTEKMSDADLKAFIASPAALLADRVRALTASSSQAFEKISAMTAGANPLQKSQIAAGLARTVYTCTNAKTDATQAYADQIQTFVAGLKDPAFASTFQDSLKQINVASIGPGAFGGVGGGATTDGTTQTSGDNKYQSAGDGPTDTTSGTYTVGSVNTFSAASDNLSPF